MSQNYWVLKVKKYSCILLLYATSVCWASASVEYMQAQADRGDARAQVTLAVMYYKGDGVRQDYAKAKQYFELAANQGNAPAKDMLGTMYQTGAGVTQSDLIAKEYFGAACDSGLKSACDEYKKLNTPK